MCRSMDQIWGFPGPEPKGQAALALCGTKALAVNLPELQSEVGPQSGGWKKDRRTYLRVCFTQTEEYLYV